MPRLHPNRCRICGLLALVVALLPGPAAVGQPLTAEQQQQLLGQAIDLGKESNRLRREGKPAEAIAAWEKRVAILRRLLGRDSEHVLEDLVVLAEMQEKHESFVAARATRQEILDSKKRLPGEEHWQVVDARWAVTHVDRLVRAGAAGRARLAEADRLLVQTFAAYKDKRYAEAAGHRGQALAIHRDVLEKDHPEVANGHAHLGAFAQLQGDNAAALPHYERAADIRRGSLGMGHPDTGRGLHSLAVVQNALAGWEAARRNYEKALPLLRKTLGAEHRETIVCLDGLASLLLATGDFTAARPLLEDRLRLSRKMRGPEHPETAAAEEHMGLLLASLGDYTAARSHYEQALAIVRKAHGEKHLETARAELSLGMMFYGLREYAKARPYYEKVLAIREGVLGEDHPDTVEAIHMVGGLLGALGDYPGARAQLERALRLLKKAPATGQVDHYRLTTAMQSLGFLLLLRGEVEAARPLLQQALEGVTKVFGPDDRTTAQALENLALLDASCGRWQEAARGLDRSRRILRRHEELVLTGLAEPEQLTFLQTVAAPSFHRALSLGLARPEDARLAALSAEWVLNGKGTAQQALAERSLLGRTTADGPTRELIRRLSTVRASLAGLTFRGPAPGEEAEHRRLREQLAREERDLARQIGQATGRPVREDPWVSLDEVRKAVPEKAVLIDIARVRVWGFRSTKGQPPWQPERYVAWVIPRPEAGEVRLIDLGEAAKIEAAARAARQALQSAARSVASQGEAESERDLRTLLGALARLVYQPLARHIGTHERWIVSPDADLWLVPWAAMPLPDGGYAVEKHEIRHVVSGRDLLHGAGPGRHGPPLVLADPDFDLEPEKAAATTERFLRQMKAELPPATRSGLLGELRWRPLPGTAREAEAIGPALERYADTAPTLHLRGQALEGVVKATPRPRVVVLSTHGFFLEDQDYLDAPLLTGRGITWAAPARKRRPGRPEDPAGPPLVNPLLRCGLALAGANRRRPGGEDGILTGLEIVGTDLRGTELVVLSACETGVGQLHNGEGVAGLRQAFQLAGAEAVLATLWKIPDEETARMMTLYFDALAAGAGKADALRRAQRAILRERRQRNGAAHPLYWAAFTLTAQGRGRAE